MTSLLALATTLVFSFPLVERALECYERRVRWRRERARVRRLGVTRSRLDLSCALRRAVGR